MSYPYLASPFLLMSLPVLSALLRRRLSQGVRMGVSSAEGLPRGYLHWQARACMCNVSSSHGHIIYLFTHLSLSPLERAHTAEVLR